MIDSRTSEPSVLMQRARAGDLEARVELLSHYRNRLKRMIAMRLDHRVAVRIDASDVVQEAINDAFTRFPDYFADPQISFYPWLRRIAWDRLMDLYRYHIGADKRSVLREHPWPMDLNDESLTEMSYIVASSGVNPGRRAMLAELLVRVKSALGQLKSHDREILVLRYMEQLGVAEIADVLGISRTAVTSRHLRALQRLRRLLGNDVEGL